MNTNNPKDVAAPEGNLSSDERQQPEASNSTTGANATDEEDFPIWDGGGYRGPPEVPVFGGDGKGRKPNKPKQGTSKNDPKAIKVNKKSVKDDKKKAEDDKAEDDKNAEPSTKK